jgi:predicted metal-dependent phosphoesterase TrpH
MILIYLAPILAVTAEPPPANPPENWYRGNTHTHTLWSDGDGAPEAVVAWYRDHDYDFLVLSDHNTMQTGEKWFAITPDGRLTPARVEDLRNSFGTAWPEVRTSDTKDEMRLRTLAELKEHFESPGEFLLIPGEEVTDSFRLSAVHINALNIKETIPPQRGKSLSETIENNVKAIAAQGSQNNTPTLAHVNHPNFRWSFGADAIAEAKGANFFEILNGHRGTNNAGAEGRPSTEVIWDRALVSRLRAGTGDGAMLYGVATDDAHSYHGDVLVSIPGRAWIMVRSASLDPDAIVRAMLAGNFYASTGVTLETLLFDDTGLSIDIAQEPNVTYVTEFHGARQGSEETELLATVAGPKPAYQFRGDELYVRARVRSSKPHPRPVVDGDLELAWTQPHRPPPSAPKG